MPQLELARNLTIFQAGQRIGRNQNHEDRGERAPDRVRQEQNHADHGTNRRPRVSENLLNSSVTIQPFVRIAPILVVRKKQGGIDTGGT